MESITQKLWRHLVLGVVISTFHFNSNFNLALAIYVAITNPNLIQFLPFTSGLVDREPRSCYEVHALKSQSRPDVV